jgi:glycolate oxidase
MEPEKAIKELGKRLQGIPFRREARYIVSYGFDATGRRGRCGAVVFPRSLEELRMTIIEARRAGVSLFMRGAGTGFSGGSVPDGGIVVSTEMLTRVLALDEEAGTVTVEAGIVNNDLQQYLEKRGLFYPPDPASFRVSTIGGNIAENAGGPRAYKYGVTRRYVRSMVWIDSGGEVIDSVPRGPAALLIGAEGTLGAIYSATLRVLPRPEVFRTALVAAGAGDEAMNTAAALLATGFTPSVLEFIDSRTMKCVSEYRELLGTVDGSSYLFFEMDGKQAGVDDQFGLLSSFCEGRGLKMMTARDEEEREILWELRRSVSPSLARKGITKINEDVSLPLGKLGVAVSWIHALASELELDCYIFGHCGDGNLHVNIMTDRRRTGEIARAMVFVEKLFGHVAEMGGTLSGEHGIGLTKKDFLGMVFGPAEIGIQRGIMRAMDPENIFNPGKYFDSGENGDVH